MSSIYEGLATPVVTIQARMRSITALAVMLLLAPNLLPQSGRRAVRKHRTEVQTPSVAAAVLDAEGALEKSDYATAEPLLLKVVAQDSQDYRAWFDLGFVYRATQRPNDAIAAYRKSVAIKPDIFESNLHLGLLMASGGDDADAVTYLRKATQLKPESGAAEERAHAWLSLGQVLAKKNETFAEALNSFRHAEKLSPKDPDTHLFAGGLFEKHNNLNDAEAEYKAALALDPKSKEALAGLVNAYTRENRLKPAEDALRDYLKLEPTNSAARLQMGRLLLKAGKTEEALGEFEEGLRSNPKDEDLQREVASVYATAKRYNDAASLYKRLIEVLPKDTEVRLQFGKVLMQLKSFRSAEEQFIEALKLNPKLADAYGNLAVAASENKDYPLAIRAVDDRAKLVPETPGTYFLRATAYDNLKSFKEAAENYRQFLARANGKYPDQEWQARHRLIAIDKSGGKKK